MTGHPAFVLLEDGTWYPGTTPVAMPPAFGEVVFTTNMTGYQETFTDPSYLGQIVVMTAPMIGNYGVNTEDAESRASVGFKQTRTDSVQHPRELAKYFRSEFLGRIDAVASVRSDRVSVDSCRCRRERGRSRR